MRLLILATLAFCIVETSLLPQSYGVGRNGGNAEFCARLLSPLQAKLSRGLISEFRTGQGHKKITVFILAPQSIAAVYTSDSLGQRNLELVRLHRSANGMVYFQVRGTKSSILTLLNDIPEFAWAGLRRLSGRGIESPVDQVANPPTVENNGSDNVPESPSVYLGADIKDAWVAALFAAKKPVVYGFGRHVEAVVEVVKGASKYFAFLVDGPSGIELSGLDQTVLEKAFKHFSAFDLKTAGRVSVASVKLRAETLQSSVPPFQKETQVRIIVDTQTKPTAVFKNIPLEVQLLLATSNEMASVTLSVIFENKTDFEAFQEQLKVAGSTIEDSFVFGIQAPFHATIKAKPGVLNSLLSQMKETSPGAITVEIPALRRPLD